MKKLLLLIIAVVIIHLAPQSVFAQNEVPDCERTLYKDDFHCTTEKVHSWCTAAASVNRAGDPTFYSFYEDAYCNITEEVSEEVYDVLEQQFQAEDPKYTADLIQFMLVDIHQKSLETYLEDVYGDRTATDELPAVIKQKYFDEGDPAGQVEIYSRLKRAYDREKIMHQSKEALKQQFINQEIWANGTLSDSPFDLIIDLNLIEIVMFGSLATWEDDVYSFPSRGGEDGEAEAAGAVGAEDLQSDDDVAEEPLFAEGFGPPVEDEGEAVATADQYACVSDDELEDLFGKEEGPSEGSIPSNCGNRQLDEGEDCDDGNNKAGDGCSARCKSEAGVSLSCQDPEAVTFKAHKMGDGAGDLDGAGEDRKIPLNCPQGSSPVNQGALAAARILRPPQSPNYPGPFIGGVLKNFPESNRPPCPPGQSSVQISIAGETTARCVPTEFCLTGSAGDFEPARKLLFGEDYKDDPVKAEAAAAIEAIVCIDVIKNKRPESPYPVNEGCIDCHILAMSDEMAGMLEGNVAPLENNFQAWGLSNRWGPNISFDVNVAVGRAVNFVKDPKYSEHSPQGLTQIQRDQLFQDATNRKNTNADVSEATVSSERPITDIVTDIYERRQKANDNFYQGLKNYRAVSESETNDKQFHNDIPSVLTEILKSFQRLSDKYTGLALATKFQDKDQCTF